MTDTTPNAPFRKIPSLDSLLREVAVLGLIEEFGRDVVVAEGRAALDEVRATIAATEAGGSTAADVSVENLVTRLRVRLEKKFAPSLSPAVNATGIIMHSGLGRAVLSEAAREALDAVALGYSTLALDREGGKRVSRDRHVEGLLRELTGAESATVANNNAAATVLILNTLARGKEVVVSRGQLVEIGGSFRMPDVMTTSGAVLREVGTTNKTHLRDYEAAVTENTGAILRVHHSNYRIVGFAEEPGIEELAALGRSRGVPVVDDLGSGALVDLAPYGLAAEPMVRTSVQAGADVVCFSGDKLIGGPQCGIIVGKSAWIQKIKKNPLARAFRCGKLSLAALEATLKLFLAPEKLTERHPIYRMLSLTPDELGRRAKKLAASLRKALSSDVVISVEDGESQVGSGAVPVETLPSKVLSVKAPGLTAEDLARRLRLLTPPIFARIHKDAVIFDFRTIQPAEDAVVERALIGLLQ
ncbi:MAG: L-seryl-tRNA(Sec) selenium transferase [Candidatus Aminicenantes bacterium]|nr:L-seryl-tRNA(Sec) selenium transferase [Candidatus Aminicenantes bacterium]